VGVPAVSLEEAFDTEDPRAALVALIARQQAAPEGARGTDMAVLAGGGAASVGVLVPALEHGAEVLDILSASTPRRGRKALLELVERVEACVESVDASWCDGLAQCDEAAMAALASALAVLRGLDPEQCGVEGAVSAVSEVLECMERCGSVVLQSLAVLRSGDGAREGARLGALDALRALSPESQGVACGDEVSAIGLLLEQMAEEKYGADVRVSAGLAVFTLICRNGVEMSVAMDSILILSAPARGG
jgi:hypothetical protein